MHRVLSLTLFDQTASPLRTRMPRRSCKSICPCLFWRIHRRLILNFFLGLAQRRYHRFVEKSQYDTSNGGLLNVHLVLFSIGVAVDHFAESKGLDYLDRAKAKKEGELQPSLFLIYSGKLKIPRLCFHVVDTRWHRDVLKLNAVSRSRPRRTTKGWTCFLSFVNTQSNRISVYFGIFSWCNPLACWRGVVSHREMLDLERKAFAEVPDHQLLRSMATM